MVSKFGSEHIVEGTPTPEHIAGYLAHFKPDGYFGAWQDGGKTYLDTSVRKKTTEGAQEFGKKNAQRAYYDIDNDAVKPVAYVPQRSFEGSLFEGHEDEGVKYHSLVNEQQRMGVEHDLRLGKEPRTARPKVRSAQRRLFR